MLTIDRIVATAAQPFTISLTAGNGIANIQAGRYVAIRQAGSQTGAYDLHPCDPQGYPTGRSVAAVYLAMRSDGVVVVM